MAIHLYPSDARSSEKFTQDNLTYLGRERRVPEAAEGLRKQGEDIYRLLHGKAPGSS